MKIQDSAIAVARSDILETADYENIQLAREEKKSYSRVAGSFGGCTTANSMGGAQDRRGEVSFHIPQSSTVAAKYPGY